MTQIDHALVVGFIQSEEQFPIDFDDAWVWLEYSTKGNAKRKLISNFTKEIDFIICEENGKFKGLHSYSVVEKIKLSLDCFKSFAIMAGTAKGKEVRNYFLKCERELKSLKQKVLPQTYAEALRQLAAEVEAKEAIAAEKAKTETILVAANAVIKEQKPKVKMAETFLETDGDYSIKELADMLDFRERFPGYRSYGLTTVYDILRQEGFLIAEGRRRNLPYERYADLFVVRAYSDSPLRPQMRISARGIEYLIRRYNLNHR